MWIALSHPLATYLPTYPNKTLPEVRPNSAMELQADWFSSEAPEQLHSWSCCWSNHKRETCTWGIPSQMTPGDCDEWGDPEAPLWLRSISWGSCNSRQATCRLISWLVGQNCSTHGCWQVLLSSLPIMRNPLQCPERFWVQNVSDSQCFSKSHPYRLITIFVNLRFSLVSN